MPGFDRSGPMGQGSRTGRGLGYCTGFAGNPGNINYGAAGYGVGRGGRPWGGGRGRCFGGAWGGRRFGFWGPAYQGAMDDPGLETRNLREAADRLTAEIRLAEQRLAELRAEEERMAGFKKSDTGE